MREGEPAGSSEGETPLDPQPTKSPRVLRLTLEYSGTRFAGWQVQANARTVQGELERALETILRHPVRANGASRTDSGVHALGQVASAETTSALPLHKIRRGLDALLPLDMGVVQIAEGTPGFHARFSALAKHYRYRILDRFQASPIEADRVWHVRERLDVDAMQRAADLLVGERDFKALVTKSAPQREERRSALATMTERQRLELIERKAQRDAVGTIQEIRVGRSPLAGVVGDDVVTIDVTGHAFLYKMVRTIAGTLCQVGRGRRAPGSIAAMLASGDRRAAGETAPAQGLVLVRVLYDDAELDTQGHAVEGVVPSEGDHHGPTHERPRLDPRVRGGEGAEAGALLRAAPDDRDRVLA